MLNRKITDPILKQKSQHTSANYHKLVTRWSMLLNGMQKVEINAAFGGLCWRM
jgi:hypothetical protein